MHWNSQENIKVKNIPLIQVEYIKHITIFKKYKETNLLLLLSEIQQFWAIILKNIKVIDVALGLMVSTLDMVIQFSYLFKMRGGDIHHFQMKENSFFNINHLNYWKYSMFKSPV